MGRRSRVVAVGATFAAAVLTITGLAGGGGAFTDLGVAPAQAATIASAGVKNLGSVDPVTGKPVAPTITPADYIWNEGGLNLYATWLQAFQYDWNRAVQNPNSLLATGSNLVAYILPGDSMTWTGQEIWPDQVGNSLVNPPPGAVLPPPGGYKFYIYGPEANLGYYGIDMGPMNPETGLTSRGLSFAMDDFDANTTVVRNVQPDGEPIPDELYDTICPQDDTHGVNAADNEVGDWCWAPIAYSVTLKDLAAYNPAPYDPAHPGFDHEQYVYAGKTWLFGRTAKCLAEHCGLLAGPQQQDAGRAIEGVNYISVVGPSLQVIKQVCTKYDGDEPVCSDDPNDGWVTDETAGDDNGTAGVTSGVPTGVEQGSLSLPAGVTKLLWRVTAIDSGNVPMVGVHVAADEVTLQSATGTTDVSVTDNDCAGMKFTDTYDASGQPSYQVLHDWQQAYFPQTYPFNVTDLVLQPPSGALAPGGGSLTQMCTTTLSAPFTGTVQNSVGLNGSFDDPADPIFPAPDRFTYNTGDGEDGSWVSISLGGTAYQAVQDITKTLQNRFTGFNNEVGQVASNVDSAQVVIPAEETTPPPSETTTTTPPPTDTTPPPNNPPSSSDTTTPPTSDTTTPPASETTTPPTGTQSTQTPPPTSPTTPPPTSPTSPQIPSSPQPPAPYSSVPPPQPPVLPPSSNPSTPGEVVPPSGVPSDQVPAGGRVQPAGLFGAIGAVGAGLLVAGVLVYRRQRPLFHTRGSRAG